MSQINGEIATILKSNDLSVTKQRVLVFEMLEGREPVSMYELYELAKGHLDRASLYRIINIFEQRGIVRRINIGWKYKIELSDKFAEHHHHLSCLKCGRIVAISEHELEDFIAGISRNHNFTPVDHEIEVQGYCDKCISVTESD